MQLTTTPLAPDLLPVPAPGKHLDPADGACLMEAASLFAGEPFSDHPSCVHPTIAALARLLNDASTDAGRTALWRLIPDVIGARTRGARTAPSVVLLVLEFAEKRCDVGVFGRLSRRRATHRLALLDHGGLSARWTCATDVLYRRTPAERSLRHVFNRLARAVPPETIDSDAPLLLARCVATTGTPCQRDRARRGTSPR